MNVTMASIAEEI